MISTIHHAPNQSKTFDDPKTRKLLFWENVTILFKVTGMVTWFIIFLLALLEIKRYFNIDLIPGYDSAIDNVYGAMRGTLSDQFGGNL